MKFNPKFGDTIVCNNNKRFICKPNKTASYKSFAIYGESRQGYWQVWDEEGFAGGVEDDHIAYNIKEIIPAEGSEPCKIAESDLEFQLKVLQKENEFLTRLLLKEGKL